MKIHISCKQASKMFVLKDEQRLSLVQRWRLTYHLFICRACKLFCRQHNLLNKHWAQAKEADICLTEDEKNSISNRMHDA